MGQKRPENTSRIYNQEHPESQIFWTVVEPNKGIFKQHYSIIFLCVWGQTRKQSLRDYPLCVIWIYSIKTLLADSYVTCVCVMLRLFNGNPNSSGRLPETRSQKGQDLCSGHFRGVFRCVKVVPGHVKGHSHGRGLNLPNWASWGLASTL